jgi:hypothetical protein
MVAVLTLIKNQTSLTHPGPVLSCRCLSPPEREQERGEVVKETRGPLTPLMRALIELDETRTTEDRAPCKTSHSTSDSLSLASSKTHSSSHSRPSAYSPTHSLHSDISTVLEQYNITQSLAPVIKLEVVFSPQPFGYVFFS